MPDKDLEELKKKLNKMLSSDEDKKKLELVKTPQQVMQFVSNFGIKLELEMRTRGPKEANEALKNLANLRIMTADFLKDEKQQMQMNEHWGKVLQSQIEGVLKYNTERQKEEKKDDGGSVNEARITALIQRLEGEARRLEGLQKGMMAAPGQLSGPTPNPDKSLAAEVKSILAKSPMSSLGKIFGQQLGEELNKKLEKAEARVDSASITKSAGIDDMVSSPFSMKPKPPTPYDKNK